MPEPIERIRFPAWLGIWPEATLVPAFFLGIIGWVFIFTYEFGVLGARP